MPSEQISHYRIIGELGRGGMGVVYRAHDETLGRDVALKVLPAENMADPSAKERLIREARTASALNHPHICTVYEVGEAEGQVFVSMELVEGKPLAGLLPPEGLAADAVARYGAQIAEALAHAHERGVVHRDLKPANIIITPEGRAKVLDFGLAQRLEQGGLDEATRAQVAGEPSDAVAGTLAYMAPEQLQGEPADSRSDVWALGVVLYEMAAGQKPFQGRTGFDLSSAILRGPLAPLPAQVPAGLRAVIQRCLMKEPGERYQRASEVRAALETLQIGLGSTSVAAPQTQATTPAQASATSGAAAEGQKSAGYPELRRYWWVILLVVLSPGLWQIVDGAIEGIRVAVRERQQAARPAELPRIQSIAVLPLANLSGDPGQEYFADGMTEALITEMAQISSLRVISRTSVMQYKGTRKSLRQIAEELRVDAVIEGSLQRSGNHVRVGVQLIHAATERRIWGKSYERDLHDVLALQSEVAQAVADGIKVRLTPQEQARITSARQVDPLAYDAYVRGRHHWYKRTPESLKKSLQYFQEAAEKDPNYASAYAGMADAYNILGWALFGLQPPREAFPRAKSAARRALEIDEGHAETHAALAWTAYVYDWDWQTAGREFKRALELNPGYAPAHIWYSHYLETVGRSEESLAESKRALEADPLGLVINMHLGWNYVFARKSDLAIDQLQKTLELDRNFILAHMFLGQAYQQKGMMAEAIREFQEAVRLSERNPVYLGGLGHAYALAGRRPEALAVLRELTKLSGQRYVPARGIAEVYIALGEKDQALLWLAKAFEERDGWLVHLGGDPRYDPLRSDPRFQALLARMNFPK